jgi:hypothetical protein
VLDNDTDVEGDALTAVLLTGPSNGSLVLNADGGFTYMPNAGFSGTDSFTCRANDGTSLSNAATVTLTVTAAELSTVSGLVYVDASNDGEVDLGEFVLEGVTVHLTGVNDLGETVSLTATTDAEGVYMFIDLRPGQYTVTEVQPSGYADGIDSLGTVNGVISGDNSVNDTFSNIVITEPGSIAADYNFGERDLDQPLQAGQTATIGFWQNKNGQKLLKSLNGGPNSSALGDWLAANFPNMYGVTAGASNLAGKTNAQVADFYRRLFARNKQDMCRLGLGGPVKMDAQVMAVAFAVYVTDSDLAGNTAAPYGFLVDSLGTGARTFNVGDNGAAFDLANGTQATIFDLLVAVDRRAYRGVLYDEDHDGDARSWCEVIFRGMANRVFSAINETGDI